MTIETTRNPHTAPTPAEVRAWAKQQLLYIGDRGRIPAEIRQAYLDAHEDDA